MTFFTDLSNYNYSQEFARAGTLNVAWLDAQHGFSTSIPSENDLDLLWAFCKISVAQMRGIHDCVFCKNDAPIVGERNGERLLLGTSEIRVFSNNGAIYSAPTLIFHYVSVHHYLPPEDFMSALRNGPRPPMPSYFEKLRELGLEWNNTSIAERDVRAFRLI